MDGKKIRYTGRFDFSDPEGPKFAWSASAVSARFFGTEASVRLKSFGNNYLLVILDGRVINKALHVEDEGTFRLAYGLSEVEHEITLVKRTEFYLGTVQFLGFDFGKGRLLSPPADSNRRIEIIGDSITCGFGNEGSPDMEYDPRYDNGWLSYGVAAARLLTADYMIIGRSGYGIIRDYEGNRSNTLPSVYHLTLPEKSEQWDFTRWIPDVVVINLGTNDFSYGYVPERKEFIRAYLDLIHTIRNHYPHTCIVCTVGPLVDGDALIITQDYVQNGIVGQLVNSSQNWISYLEFPHQKAEDGYGISMHPSVKTHEFMGKRLSDEIRRIKNW